MKVILKNKIKKLGNIGDVVEVKDGYAKNMLIPNGLALFYTEKNYEFFKTQKENIEKQNNENKAKAEDLMKKILGKDLILIENAGDDGKLYGSITGMKLANFINSTNSLENVVKKSNITLKDAIKNVGKYEIIVELHPEVSFEKIVIIARSKEEANKIKKGELTNAKKESNEEEILLAQAEAAKAEAAKVAVENVEVVIVEEVSNTENA